MAEELGSTEVWPTRFSRGIAFSAFVHFLHSAAILALVLFVPAPAGAWLRGAWAIGAFFSATTLLVLLRVGSYEGTNDAEVARLIRQGYWVATSIYLGLLAASLFFLLARR